MASNHFLSVMQADKFGQSFKEAIQSSFPDLRPTVNNIGRQGVFGPVSIQRIVVNTDNKLEFSIEDMVGEKHGFLVNPVITCEVEGDRASVVVQWEVETLITTPMGWKVIDTRVKAFRPKKPPRSILEDLLKEKNSKIQVLVSEPQICGLEDHGRAREMIQDYLDEFSAIVFMDSILKTYG